MQTQIDSSTPQTPDFKESHQHADGDNTQQQQEEQQQQQQQQPSDDEEQRAIATIKYARMKTKLNRLNMKQAQLILNQHNKLTKTIHKPSKVVYRQIKSIVAPTQQVADTTSLQRQQQQPSSVAATTHSQNIGAKGNRTQQYIEKISPQQNVFKRFSTQMQQNINKQSFSRFM